MSFIGPKPNLLDINQVNPPMRLEVSQPVLNFADMAKLRDIEQHTQGKFRSYTLDITYPFAWGHEGVEAKLASLCAEAVDAIKGGKNILIISDRALSATQVAIPALLALSCHSPASGERRLAHHGRPGGGNRYRPRSTPLCGAGRLRRRSRAPLLGDGNTGQYPQGFAWRFER